MFVHESNSNEWVKQPVQTYRKQLNSTKIEKKIFFFQIFVILIFFFITKVAVFFSYSFFVNYYSTSAKRFLLAAPRLCAPREPPYAVA